MIGAEKVKAIIDLDGWDDGLIEGYIESADNFLQEAYSGVAVTDRLYDEVSRWLTAHMIASTRERVSVKEGAGGAEIQYADIFEKGLNSTQYGQTAVALDTTGRLNELSGGKQNIYFKAVSS